MSDSVVVLGFILYLRLTSLSLMGLEYQEGQEVGTGFTLPSICPHPVSPGLCSTNVLLHLFSNSGVIKLILLCTHAQSMYVICMSVSPHLAVA